MAVVIPQKNLNNLFRSVRERRHGHLEEISVAEKLHLLKNKRGFVREKIFSDKEDLHIGIDFDFKKMPVYFVYRNINLSPEIAPIFETIIYENRGIIEFEFEMGKNSGIYDKYREVLKRRPEVMDFVQSIANENVRNKIALDSLLEPLPEYL